MIGFSVATNMGAARRAGGPVDVIVLVGDSNARGSQSDPQNVSYTADPLTWAWNGSAWAQYAPNTNAGYSPAAGLTGLHFGTAEGRWGPEMRIAQQYRAANPGRRLFIFKYAAAGSFAMYDATATSSNTFLAWDAATGGALQNSAKAEFDQAWNALVAAGYSPVLRLIDINLGANDASSATTAAGFQTAISNIIAAFRSNWHFTTGTTRIVLNRVPTAGAGGNVAAVRTATLAVAQAASDVFWVDLDASANNGGGDTIHFNAAGLIANGNAVWSEYISPENALIMALGSDLIAWWDAGYGVSLSGAEVTAWRDRVGDLSPAQSTSANRPTWASSDFTGGGPSLTFDGTNDTLSLSSGFGGLPVGSTASWIFGLATQAALPADTGNRTLVSWGGNVSAPSTERRLRRAVVSGANRAQMLVGIGGGSNATATDSAADLSGRNLIAAKIGASSTQIGVNGGAEATVSAVPATGNSGTTLTQLTLGSGPATQYWQGKVRDIVITKPLDAAKEAALRAFLSAR